MRSSQEVYKEVAERCSAYDKCSGNNCFKNANDGSKSCLNCSHFSDKEYCELDLYDAIVKDL